MRTILFRASKGLAGVAAALWLSACSTTGVLLTVAGVATDTSMTWAIVKHLHAQATEGDPIACHRLGSVERALSPRCGAFVPGRIQAADIAQSPLQSCALTVAAGDARLWPALPELLDKGALPEACARSPLVELARQPGCPDFTAASPEVVRAFRWLAEADARAVHHDVVRLLSCPQARRAGLDAVLDQWLAQGELDRGKAAFSPLAALHPDHLDTPLTRALEAQGHTAHAALGAYDGQQPGGFEAALRLGHWAALEWWLARAPELANRVPAAQRNQLPWLPLARVLVPSFMADPARQREMVGFLMTHGADPLQRLPFDAGRSVIDQARSTASPLLPLLEAPPPLGSAGLFASAALRTDQNRHQNR